MFKRDRCRLRRRAEFLAFFDERINDVNLPAGVEVLAQKLRRLRQLRVRPHRGDDPPAAGRQLVEHGNFEVAVNRDGQGARDRRGSHHQHVGHRPLAAAFRQGGALEHAEFVLLINHRQPEPGRGRFVVKQRVRADINLRRRPAKNLRQITADHFLFPRAGAQRQPHAERLQPTAKHQEMLLGQDLRRRHERGLIPGLHAEQHRRDGDERFARADVALEQSVHRPRRLEIGADFGDGAALRAGRREGERGEEAVEQRAVPGVVLAELRGGLRAARGDDELHREKLRHHQVPPRGLQLGFVGREMDPLERDAARPRVEPVGQRRVEFFQLHAPQRVVDQPPQHPLAHALGRRVDRRDAPQVDERFLLVALAAFAFEDLELRVIDDHIFSPRLRLAVNHEPLAVCDDFLDVKQVEPAHGQPRRQGMAGRLLNRRLEERLAAGKPLHRGADDQTADAHRLVPRLGREVFKLPAVFVTTRIMPDQIADRAQPQPFASLRARRPEAGDLGQRLVERERDRCRWVICGRHRGGDGQLALRCVRSRRKFCR